MILDLIAKNIGTVIELLIMIGAGLVFLGHFRSDLSTFMKDTNKSLKELGMKMDRQSTDLNDVREGLIDHQRDQMPHSVCMVEKSRSSDIDKALNDLRLDIKRVEGWVMALANKQGIKEPRNGD